MLQVASRATVLVHLSKSQDCNWKKKKGKSSRFTLSNVERNSENVFAMQRLWKKLLQCSNFKGLYCKSFYIYGSTRNHYKNTNEIVSESKYKAQILLSVHKKNEK